jgi:hypothetical protein
MFDQFLGIAKTKALELGYVWDERLEPILRYCAQSPDFQSFPGKFKSNDRSALEAYFQRYLKRYFDARETRLILKEVGTVPDPAVDVILQAFAGLKNLQKISGHHRKAMAAENLLGELLERYIATRLESHGWVWCAGSSVRAVDFLKKDLSIALQVKNRDNSENSSSSAIRFGTDIKKWFRIFARTGKTNWDDFPERLDEPLTEEGFYAFIETYARSS